MPKYNKKPQRERNFDAPKEVMALRKEFSKYEELLVSTMKRINAVEYRVSKLEVKYDKLFVRVNELAKREPEGKTR